MALGNSHATLLIQCIYIRRQSVPILAGMLYLAIVHSVLVSTASSVSRVISMDSG